MLRVLYILHTLERAGVEKLVYDLICSNVNVIKAGVVCLDVEGELADDLRSMGVDVYFTDRKSGIDIGQIFRIANIIRHWRPDVIHAHQYTPFFYSSLADMFSGGRRGKLIFTEHGRHFPDRVSLKRKLFNKILFNRTKAITAVCEFTKRALVANEGVSADKIEIIYNGVKCDIEGEKIGKSELGLTEDWPVIVHVGNFRRVKNQGFAIRVLRALREKGHRLYFVFIGDGEELPRCVKMADELGLRDYVRFLGRRDDVFSVLSVADIMINTSVTEAFSIAMLEGMLAGLPIVATNVGGNCEIVVENETGFLIELNDVNHFAGAIDKLICDVALREQFGTAGSARVISEFCFDKTNEQYLALYRRIAGV